MPRVTNQVARHKKKKKIRRLAKGYRGGRSKLYRTAKNAVERSWSYSYRDRRNRKRDFRRLWITRINAAARQHDITYSHFMNGLRTAGVELNRKTLADIAVRDPNVFGGLVAVAKEALAE
ncbi:MAG: 50S ribosomal protein L20 [Gemmatimonadetes bacterium]|nr:50S ribosomal protein L20 [Gemmatimonadota bacterium]NIO33043.1 50S ribosomal protein L20 [Gemmatimonadota bacterium]